MKQNKKIIGIYHKDCIDGTSSAAVLLKKFPEIELFPLQHGYSDEEFSGLLKGFNQDTIVYIVDFSLKINNYQQLLSQVAKVINLDHHMGVKEVLEKVAGENDNFEFVFNNERSGASITWEYFYGRDTLPELIALVEDGDIAKFEFPEKTKQSGGVLMPLANKPAEVLPLFDMPIEEIVQKGGAVIDFMDFLIDSYLARYKPIMLNINKLNVIAYNVTYGAERMKSTLAHSLVKRHKATVAIFRITGDEVNLSFRGLDGVNPSALDLAQALGGNGHRNASGARISLRDFMKAVIVSDKKM